MLYGEVSCDAMHGLSYTLTGVEVSDPNDSNNVYDVVANAATVSYAVNPLTGNVATGSNIDFQYLSFGFESYGGGGNQNQVNVQCLVELNLSYNHCWQLRCDCMIESIILITLRYNC